MSNTDQFALDLIKILMDPNATDNDLDALLEDVENAAAAEGLPPEEERAKNEREALLLLAKQDKNTSTKEIEHYLNTYYSSLELARLVARHPSIDDYWLAHFTHFLPEDAALNPNLPVYSENEKWHQHIQNSNPKKAESSYWAGAGVRSGNVDEKKPWRYKVNYWLKHGSVSDKRYIVSLPSVDEKTIEYLASDKSAHIRKEVAKRYSLSQKLAERISADKAKTVRQTLAENQKTPTNVLVTLTKDKEEAVRKAALNNPSCPEDAIHAAKLAEASKPKEPAKPLNKLTDQELIKIIGTPSTESDSLEGLAELEHAHIRAGVALHVNCPKSVLVKLANDSDIMVKQCVGFNPNTPNEVLQTLLDSKDSDYHLALASNPSLNEEQQLHLVEIGSETVRTTLADTTELESVWCALRDSPLLQKTKSKAKNWRDSLKTLLDTSGKGLYALQRGVKTRQLFVAKLISRHPKCPDSLKGNYSYYLFDSLAQNPNVALQLLENPQAIKPQPYADWKLDQWLTDGIAPGHVANFYLQSDDIKRRRRAVDCWTACIRYIQPQVFYDDILMKKRIAANPRSTHFMLEILARDKKESVRELVAKNKACPSETLAFLANDKVSAVKVAARQNNNFKASLVKASIGKGDKEEFKNKGPKRNRIRMADEAKSIGILKDLAGDKVEDVRVSVAKNPKTPLDTLTVLANDDSAKVREAVANHDKASIELLESLFKDEEARVRLYSLNQVNWRKSKSLETVSERHSDYDYKNRIYDEDTLANFYNDENERIQKVVARCTGKLEIQKKISDNMVESICESLASNRQLDKGVASLLIKSKKRKVLSSLIRHTTNQKIYLDALKADETLADQLNRNYSMIQNPEVQAILITDKNPSIRESCIYYLKDPDLLLSLVNDENERVIDNLCYNENLTQQHVEELLKTGAVSIVTKLLERHPKLIKPYISKLIDSKDDKVRAAVAQSAKLQVTWEKKLREDPSTLVRRALIKNWQGGVSKETKELLKNDSNEKVREDASYYFN